MLSQRLAKKVLINSLAQDLAQPPGTAARATTHKEFFSGLDYLDRLPLTNAEIARELQATHLAWHGFQRGLASRATLAGRAEIVASIEVLLGHFDRLTDMIERGVHALIGF